MNKVKFFLAGFAILILCEACSESASVAGTAEEPNEIAVNESSDSEQTADVTDCSSSSNDDSGCTPSSSSYSDYWAPSERPTGESEIMDLSSLNGYLFHYGLLGKYSFDANVFAATLRDEDKKGFLPEEPSQGNPTEARPANPFTGSGVYKIDNQDSSLLVTLFPETADEIIAYSSTILNGDACNLYLLAMQGESMSAGYVLAEVSADSLTVLDVGVGECGASTLNQLVSFVFVYCGDMNENPQIVHVPVQNEMTPQQCSEQSSETEWLKK
ncbi:hypothetical protein [uncultured Fibrobacter sp.]|uniref:hypothetical protein n=1 Tax=uncultured Fibrobacter sp. TaxID=261512 RepID=UPI0026206239|nr:hypothetical protein [uncultured Fibrobacter sp.]